MEVIAPNAVKATWHGLRNLFRPSELGIGTRLGACFVAIVVLMLAVDGLAAWQFRRMAAATEGLSNADQMSLAVIRVHLDIDIFRGKVAALANSHDTHQFASEVAALEQTFLQDVEHAEQTLSTSPEIERDAAISSALETLKVTIPSQLRTATELAAAGDWIAVRLRLEQQIQDLIGLSSSLVERVDHQMLRARTQAIQNTQQARQTLFIVGPIAGLLTLLAAAALGWYVTRTITVPLSKLSAGAEALARGDFQHRLAIFGNDELAVLARAYNYAAGQLQEVYEGLRRSQTELRDLIENVPAMVFIALPGPSNAFASRRWREYTSLSAEDTAGLGWQTVVHPEDLDRHMAKWRVCSATGCMFDDEARFRRGVDGEYRWFLTRAVALKDQSGKIVNWYGVMTDIEDRKRAESALSESRQRYQMLFEKANDAIFLENERDEIIEVNRRACDLLGYSREELLRMKVSDLPAPEFRAEAGSVVRGRIEKHGGNTFEAVDLHRSGRRIAVEVTYTPISVEGQKLILSIVRDITQRKRREQELRQLQAAQFEIRLQTQLRERTRIARELHDTLLQSFQGLLLRFQSALNMLPERPLEARQRLESAIEQAAAAITAARDAIQGLRSFAAEISDLGRAITAVGEELTVHHAEFNPPDIQVEVKGATRSLKPIVRDEAYRIAGEAVRNAFQHARAQRIAVEIRYEEGQFRLGVSDDGTGLDEEAVGRAVASGHFGLNGMRERAEIVGGRLEIWSNPDSGTQVELSIPGDLAYGESAGRSWLSKILSRNSRDNGTEE
jgi:PAS domain S-box-containing protein